MNFVWNQIPFFRLLFPFIIGILFQIYLRPPIVVVVALLIFFLLSYILVLQLKKIKTHYRYSWIYGVLLSIVLFFLGSITVIIKTTSNSKYYINNYEKINSYVLRVSKPYLEKERSIKIIAQIIAVKENNRWRYAEGNVMIYLAKDSSALSLQYGDELFVNTKLTDIKPPQNPNEFNYKQYLEFHNIYHQAYASSKHWKKLNANSGNNVFSLFYSIRSKLLSVLSESGLEGDEFAVASALILGFEDKLDADIISAYSTTGAMHVLSVSGLHVGIIFFVFNLLLSFLDRVNRGNVIKAVILLCSLWFYAGLTGFSPSVLRASTMFSFIIIAQAFRYYTNIFNTLAASCFLLLFYNPYLIMEVGFQLSFLAVLGIVYIQPKLSDRWQPENKILKWIWDITSVSIAAQLATFPLGLLYFHQFPNLFLLSNLVVIPISTLILYLGILLFIFSGIDLLAILIGKALNATVLALNSSVKYMDKLPYAIVEGVSINVFQTWLIYIFIIFCLLFFIYKSRKHLIFLLSFSVLILLTILYKNANQYNNSKIVFYAIPHSTAIDCVEGKENVFISDTALINNKSRMLFHVKHNWWNLGVTRTTKVGIDTLNCVKNNFCLLKNNIICFKDVSILLLDSTFNKIPFKSKIAVDFIVIRDNFYTPNNLFISKYEFKKVILDCSNNKKITNRWKKQFVNLSDKLIVLNETGALTIDYHEF